MIRKSRTLLTLLVVLLPLPLVAPGEARAEDRPVLELSLDEAVKRALENNVDIAVQRYAPESSGQSVFLARGVYDPFLSSTLVKRSSQSPVSNAFAGAQKPQTDTFTYNFGVNQYLGTGGSLSLTFNNNKQDTNSAFVTVNPQFNSTLTASLTQPLLRNFQIDNPRLQLRVAKKNKEISDVQFRQIVIGTVAGVKQQYYDFTYSIDNLGAARKSLALAQKLLDENRIKVRVGTMAPLDVVAAESEVASRQSDVIVAEAALADAEDTLKRGIFPRSDPAMWATRIVPTDHPTAEAVPVDIEAALKKALDERTDVVAARKSLETADMQAHYAHNQVLPQVDFIASYGATGLGGDLLTRQSFGSPVIISRVPGGYGDALSSVFGLDFPTWSLGVNLSYPIRNRQAAASSAIARIARDQADAVLRRLELLVAQEVRSAGRAVESNFRRVAATQAARVLSAQRLDAEEKKFAAGMSTSFLVTQAQRDLAVAEVAELLAVAAYRKSIINFERAQEAGLSTAGGLTTVSTGTTSATPTSATRSTTTSSTTTGTSTVPQ